MPVNLDHLAGGQRPRVHPASIVSIVLLCIAIVAVVGLLIKLGLTKRGSSTIVDPTAEESPSQVSAVPAPVAAMSAAPAAPAVPAVSLVPEPMAVAVGAAVVSDGGAAAVDAAELPYIEASGAAAGGPHGMDAMANAGVFGDLSVHDTTGASIDAGFGNIVPESHRMEGVSADALNLGAVMPSSWRGGTTEGVSGQAAPDHIHSESESNPLHDYFTPFGSESETSLQKEHPRWSELRLSREAVKRVIENIPDVTRNIVLRPANKVGLDPTAALRPATLAPLATTSAHVFQDSQARLEVLSLGLQGTYPVESRGVA